MPDVTCALRKSTVLNVPTGARGSTKSRTKAGGNWLAEEGEMAVEGALAGAVSGSTPELAGTIPEAVGASALVATVGELGELADEEGGPHCTKAAMIVPTAPITAATTAARAAGSHLRSLPRVFFSGCSQCG